MKKAMLFALLFSVSIFSQNKNFTIENNLITWKFVYEDSTSVKELRNNPRLEFKTDSTGYIKKGSTGSKKLYPYTAEFKVEQKKGKYRITVYNIVSYNDSPITINSGSFSVPTSSEYTAETALIKSNGKIKESIWGVNMTEILNTHFADLFTIKKKEKSEW